LRNRKNSGEFLPSHIASAAFQHLHEADMQRRRTTPFLSNQQEEAMSKAKTITDHDQIRKWAEQRGARPSRVHATAGKNAGILRFDFGDKDEALEEISWNEFFEIFEKNELALLEQDKTADGNTSRFSKFVHRHHE